ncbi:hypothetical protein ABK040_014093 [Willaertia magna]
MQNPHQQGEEFVFSINKPSKGSSNATASSSTTSATTTANTDYSYDLPRSNILRIVKKAVSDQITPSNETKIAFSKAAVVFIMYLTATAQEQATKHKRTTLMADDVLEALDELELGEYKEELLKTLQHFRISQKAKKSSSAKPQKKRDTEEL